MAALSVVALNSAAAAALAARARLLDYPVILVLLAAALTGSLIGALGTSVLQRSAFAAIFAALLIAGCASDLASCASLRWPATPRMATTIPGRRRE